eukprot:gene18677-22301_t
MASNGETQDILISTAGNVSTITLNRPKRGNAITKLMATEIVSSLESMEADPSLRVIILTGAGKYFCTGMDLGGGSDIQSLSPGVDAVVGMFERVRTCSKPVIALVNGPALGGGVGLVFACDFRFALKHVFFEFSEDRLHILEVEAVENKRVMSTDPRKWSTSELGGTVVEGPEGPGAVEAVGVRFEGVKGKVVVEGSIAVVEGGEGSAELVTDPSGGVAAHAPPGGVRTAGTIQPPQVCDGEESIAAHAKAMSTIKKLVRHVADNNHENGVAYAKGVFKEMMVSEEARYGITSFQKKEKPDWTSFAAKSKL